MCLCRCLVPAGRPHKGQLVPCWVHTSRPLPRPPLPARASGCTPSPPTALPHAPATPTCSRPEGGASHLAAATRRRPQSQRPLKCSQNGWRLDQLICKTGVNRLSRRPHSRRERRHLLCSKVAAPAACLSGEMEMKGHTKAPRSRLSPGRPGLRPPDPAGASGLSRRAPGWGGAGGTSGPLGPSQALVGRHAWLIITGSSLSHVRWPENETLNCC